MIIIIISEPHSILVCAVCVCSRASSPVSVAFVCENNSDGIEKKRKEMKREEENKTRESGNELRVDIYV